jgi:hypothetical protein
MMRWPVLPDSDDEDFDEAQRDEPDMRLGLEEYQSEGRTFHVEFEDKDSEDVNLIVGGPVELDSYERIRWRSTWWQNDIGQLSLTWRAADGNPR